MEHLRFALLGSFEIEEDGAALAPGDLSGRARDLVKLLALAPEHRLPREAVVEALWPHLNADAGLSNLHKAAHHARRAFDDAEAVVLREGQVALAPHAEIETDVERFEATGDPTLYRGELLADDPYAEWAQERREELAGLYRESLRAASRWEELAAENPADKSAQQAVMRARFAAGDRAGALQAFERLRESMAALGLEPGMETVALHARIAGGAALDRALAAVEGALAEAPVAERTELLATRADLLLAIGDRGAPAAYAEAAAAAGPEGMALRIRQAWAQLAIGDAAAAQATLAPLAPSSEVDQANRLIAQAAAAWFSGDVDGARRAAAAAEPIAIEAGLAGEARGAIQIQTMVAHSSGQWPETLRESLEGSLRSPDLADTLFDGHLCVAEYAITSGEPHERLRELGEELHARSVRSGARRAQAFAATLLGELALIGSQMDEADEKLREAIRISREIGAVAGEALATARLGELAHARGEQAEGDALFADAFVISHWSPLSYHIQPLAHAALLRGTEEPELARQRLDDAEAQIRGDDRGCAYCEHAFNVVAAAAAARAGQPERAEQALASAEATSALWDGGPWQAALEEAYGEVAAARGDPDQALERLRSASTAFAEQGWDLDAARVSSRLHALS